MPEYINSSLREHEISKENFPNHVDVNARRFGRLPGLCFWIFIAVAIVVASLMPHSGQGWWSIQYWNDQGLFLKAAQEVAQTGRSALIEVGRVGAAYVAVVLLLDRLTGVGLEASLILLSKLSYLAASVMLVVFAWNRTATIPGRLPKLAAMGIAILVPASSVWGLASDLPWTHFPTSALLVALVALTFSQQFPLMLKWWGIGFIVALVWQMRSFEGNVVFIAGVLAIAVSLIFGPRGGASSRLGSTADLAVKVGAGGFGAAAALVFCFLMAGSIGLGGQYSDQGDIITLSMELVPIKFVQLFVDPCFFALCSLNNYEGGSVIPGSLLIWRQPLFLQLPAIAGGSVAICIALAVRFSSIRVVFYPPVLFALLMAGGLILGYSAGLPSGSPHLKYGFFRDFIAPMLLLGMVVIALFPALATSESDVRPVRGAFLRQGALATVMVAFAGSTLMLMALRPVGLPRLEGYHLEDVAMKVECADDACGVRSSARNIRGEDVALPDVGLLYLRCGGDESLRVMDVDEISIDPSGCSQPVMAGFMPAALGQVATPEERSFLYENLLPIVEEAERRIPAPLEIGQTLALGGNAAQTRMLSSGWSAPEPWGVWSTGAQSQLNIVLDDALMTDLRLTINGNFFLSDRNPSNSAEVIVNGHSVGVMDATLGNNVDQWTFSIPASMIESPFIIIVLKYRSNQSPASLGLGSDERPIAFGLFSVRLES